jgi:uncharacterized protein (DUF1501 family)
MPRIPSLSRRDWLRLSTAGVLGASMSGWLAALARGAARDPQRKRSCILLWMNGGPSQMDTFDLKPGHENGGPYREIKTTVPGIHISEHLPQLARHADRLAIIRSMSTREADHGRGAYLMHTGHAPGGPINYPPMGALFAQELEAPDLELPPFVSIAPNRGFAPAAYESGFLGPQYAPVILADGAFASLPGLGGGDYAASLKIQDFDRPTDVSADRAAARVRLLQEADEDFLRDRAAAPSLSHRAAYKRAVTLMRSAAAKAFRLDDEPKELRDRYGGNLFGQGCLLARRLVERGVPFVEVTLSGVADANSWDTHRNNFEAVKKLSAVLDPAWATLMADLKDRGLLDSTLIVWAGEFGRTPRINTTTGRDHWARSWSTVLAGGGIRGGQVVGKTSPDGTDVTERPVDGQDFLATVGLALGVDVTKQNNSNVGRPIRIAEPTAKPIKEVLA